MVATNVNHTGRNISLGAWGRGMCVWGLAIFGMGLFGCGGAQGTGRGAPSQLPKLDAGRFSVVVAPFEGDEDRNRNGVGDAVERVLQDLQEFTKPSKRDHQGRGLHLMPLNEAQTPSSWSDNNVSRGHEKARQWLGEAGANMVIRGKVTVVAGEHRVMLHVTSSDDHHGGRYTVPEMTLPAMPAAELEVVLGLVVGTEYGAYEVLADHYIAWTLKRYLFEVEALSAKADFLARWTEKDEARLWWVLGFAQFGTGEQMGKKAIIERSLDSFGRAEKELSSANEVLRARLRLNRASVMKSLGERDPNPALLDEAIVLLESILDKLPRKAAPLQWAATWSTLGMTLAKRGERENGKERLIRAVAAFEQALLERTQERTPEDWAETQHNLGTAQQMLGMREQGTKRIESALQAFHAAHLVYTRERSPLDWARTWNNLGNGLILLGERETGSERLEAAIDAYRQALLERTRDRSPRDWAETQNNLGLAHHRLGERTGGSEHFEEAVEALQNALLVWTREDDPIEWAKAQSNLGIALLRLGEKETGTERLAKAVEALEQSLLVQTRERAPGPWAITQNSMAVALQTIGDRENDIEQIERAILLHRETLVEFTRERGPLQWAMMQNNLGNALVRLTKRKQGTKELDEAADAYDRALMEYTQERLPLQWAVTQINRGIVTRLRGERTRKPQLVCEALRVHLEIHGQHRDKLPPVEELAKTNIRQDLRALQHTGKTKPACTDLQHVWWRAYIDSDG